MVCKQLLAFAIRFLGREISAILFVQFRCSNSVKNNFIIEIFKCLWELKQYLSFLEMAKFFHYFQTEVIFKRKRVGFFVKTTLRKPDNYTET